MYEYTGNIHMHSTFSDGALTIPEIAALGNKQGLNFLIVTDHQTLAGLDQGQEWYYGQTLVLVGMEVNEHSHHYLALDVRTVVPDNESNPQKVIDAVNQQQGIGIIAHPIETGSKYYHNGLTFLWTDWSVQDFQGIEIWNHLSRWRDELTGIFRGLLLILKPSLALHKGPYRETLKILDHYQGQGQRVFAYGGSDAHGIRFKLPLTSIEIGSYEQGFRSINMHILTDQPLQNNLEHDRQLIYQALAQGNSWVACDYYRNSRGFRFEAQSPRGKWGMGSTISWHRGIDLLVKTPYPARVSMLRNGEIWASSQGKKHRFSVNRSGVYRVEAEHRRGWGWQPWIFSNPIWISE
ncbi:MAG TPA: CehA/McbA family metallohydrolase [Syntrophomonadaceae bacterium]|nr:CehA/McbA family metallohydrolase [Syntrophomonadaceae bacterium]HPU47841.1 CehA/McbA family metallohydrolase [Syntrophomonadaceae bacterium]